MAQLSRLPSFIVSRGFGDKVLRLWQLRISEIHFFAILEPILKPVCVGRS